MAVKKLKVFLTCCGVSVALVFIAIAAAAPPFLMYEMKKKIHNAVLLKESDHNKWGRVPGDVKAEVYHNYHFFNLLNPDEVLYFGATPVLEEKNGYIYREYDYYMNRSYTKYDGTSDAWVHFFPLQWVDRSELYPWNDTISGSDNITTINVGAFGVWDQSKHLIPEQIAVSVLYSLAVGFNSAMPLGIYSQFIRQTLLSFDYCSDFIYLPAGVSAQQAEALWSDDRFGWSDWTTLQVWVQAFDENSVNYTFAYPPAPRGSLHLLMDYFDLSESQVTAIFNNITESYQLSRILVKNNYQCPTPEDVDFCDGQFLGAVQWATQEVTMSPPLGLNPTPSIAASNASIHGYPEIAYFMNVTGVSDVNVQWTVDDYYRLFDYNLTTGWPSGSTYTLLDIGHMTQFFSSGRAGNFGAIQTQLGLASAAHAEVLWNYVNSLVNLTALQGRGDNSKYDLDNRGIASELSLGTFASQALYGVVYGTMAEVLPLAITSMYAFASLVYDLNSKCEDFATSVTCGKQQLQWTSWQNFQLWVSAAWGGPTSSAWAQFASISGLSDSDMSALFASTGPFATTLGALERDLKEYYQCESVGPRCFSYELAEKQWGRSAVSEDLPAVIGHLGIANSTSIVGWGLGFPVAPEYSAFIASRNLTAPLTDTQVRSLLSFSSLLSAVEVQTLFIYVFDGNMPAVQQTLGVENAEAVLDYLRFVTDKFAFNGMFITKTVDEWLWTGVDPLLETVQTTNPLLGGNPAINPTSVQLGQNQSVAFYDQLSTSFRTAMNTGERTIDQLRWFRLYNGVPYMNVLQQVYLGHSPQGPVIEWQAVNPWKEEIPIIGGDAWTFQPDISSSSNISLYLNQNSRSANGQYLDMQTIDGFECYRFTVGAMPLLMNSSTVPFNDVFYQNGPEGTVNQSSVLSSPLFASKPYFKDCKQ